MIIKVCGITEVNQVKQLAELGINMIGFNFYPPSSRFLPKAKRNEMNLDITSSIVAVVVNESIDTIRQISLDFGTDTIQLHGDETPAFCAKLATEYNVIKALGISTLADVEKANSYQDLDYLLFDTKTSGYGGSGRQFDWSLLDAYTGDTPFLIAGGIAPSSIEHILRLTHPRFVGVDLNSKFESSPGIKQMDKIKAFKEALDKDRMAKHDK